MPYTTGSAADMDAVKTALVNACTSDGWTEETDADGKTVLSKNGIYVRVESFADGGDGNPAFDLLGRTSLDGGDAPKVVSMRTIGSESISLPVTYHIFTFTYEVYMVINWLNIYQWCAFGQSAQNGLPGTGNWVAAPCCDKKTRNGIQIKSDGYMGGSEAEDHTSAALFWGYVFGYYTTDQNCWVHNDIEPTYPWALSFDGNYGGIVGIKYLTEIINTQPNSFNSESVLMPIRAYKKRSESKVSQVLELLNARHIRVDNYNNEQIITLGTDEWMVFPWYKKDIDNRDGGEQIQHTGTFGWAIKKES